jgi:hypothetical protein
MSEATAVATPAVETPAAGFLGASAAAAAPEATATPGFLFGEHVQEGGAFKEGWTNALAEKFPRVANTAMRYKTEADFLQGIDHALGLVGKKTAGVSYPKAGATPEEITAFRTESGIPARAEEYQLKPAALPEGVAWDDATGKQFAEIMHANHIPPAAAQALVEAHLKTLAEQGQSSTAAAQAKQAQLVQQTTAEFQREWGVDFQNRVDANNDFIHARLTPEDIADPALKLALSHPAVVRMIDEARRSTREAPLPGVNSSVATGSMSPRQQALDIMKANQNWRQNPETHKRVNDLYAQEAQAQKRKAR